MEKYKKYNKFWIYSMSSTACCTRRIISYSFRCVISGMRAEGRSQATPTSS